MTRGWGEIARVYRARGALTIRFEYDGASTLFFKVFDAEGRRLECCSGEEREADACSARDHSSSSPWESSSSPELYETPETSDDNYVPPISRRAWSNTERPAAAVADLDGVGAGLPWPTVDDGVDRIGSCR